MHIPRGDLLLYLFGGQKHCVMLARFADMLFGGRGVSKHWFIIGKTERVVVVPREPGTG